MKKILIIGSFIGLVLIAVLVLVTKLQVKTITCTSQYGPCNSEVETLVKGNEMTQMFLAYKNLKKQLQESPFVDDYYIQIKSPTKLNLNIHESKPIYAIRSNVNNSYALINERGIVLKIEDKSVLPYLVINEELPAEGGTIDEMDLFLVDLIYDLDKMQYSNYGEKMDFGMTAEIQNRYEAIFPLEGNKKELLGALNIILAKIAEPSENNEDFVCMGKCKIDLRYNNPIISN